MVACINILYMTGGGQPILHVEYVNTSYYTTFDLNLSINVAIVP